mmetsp:Transcript_43128/g.63974  ORF Transcript_43128/g.63974 Transcript_43128/m.63974 type:complete len:96 (-) Transcript_43128:20-307(-)
MLISIPTIAVGCDFDWLSVLERVEIADSTVGIHVPSFILPEAKFIGPRSEVKLHTKRSALENPARSERLNMDCGSARLTMDRMVYPEDSTLEVST